MHLWMLSAVKHSLCMSFAWQSLAFTAVSLVSWHGTLLCCILLFEAAIALETSPDPSVQLHDSYWLASLASWPVNTSPSWRMPTVSKIKLLQDEHFLCVDLLVQKREMAHTAPTKTSSFCSQPNSSMSNVPSTPLSHPSDSVEPISTVHCTKSHHSDNFKLMSLVNRN